MTENFNTCFHTHTCKLTHTHTHTHTHAHTHTHTHAHTHTHTHTHIHTTDVDPEVPNISNITTTSTTQTQLVSAVNLTCEATGALPLTYRWYRDGQILKGKIRPYLYIPEFSPEDRGNYSCQVINDEGKDESSGALLTIKGNTPVTLNFSGHNSEHRLWIC